MAEVRCPNCFRPMRLVRTLEREAGEDEINVYQCSACNVSFVTEDHMPVSGPVLR